MSGICGVLCLDGAPASRAAAAAMLAAQAHRGDRVGVYAAGSVALGATLRDTVPESVREDQPINIDDRLVLVADARIDNRDELIGALGRRGAPVPTDADLILAAYERWGAGAPERLIGDFAFAIWDTSRRELFCARDAMGVRPFCYTEQSGRRFAFASEIKALFALAEVPRAVDEARLIAYMDGRDAPHEETFFAGVRRLPPGHHLTVHATGSVLVRYWRPDPDSEIRMPRLDDYVDAFRATFDEAVRSRLRSQQRVGSMLSGGLDSSAVTSAARRLTSQPSLPTFSFRFDEVPASDERHFQDLLVSGGGYQPNVVQGDRLDPFVDFDRILHFSDEPSGAGNLFLHWSAWDQARAAGVGVLLDGFFGDSAISYGDDRLAELLRRGRLWTWVREILARTTVEGGGRRIVRSLILGSVRAQVPQWIRTGTRQRSQSQIARVFVPLAPAASSRLPAHATDTSDNVYRTVRRRQVEDIEHEAYTPLFEVMNRAAAGAGVEVRFPFADRRLLDFCVALPSAVKQRDGWDRWILRAGMDERVPAPVRWRVDKADLLPNLARGLQTTGRARLAAELEDAEGPLARFVDRAALNEQLRRLDAGDSEPVAALWTAACASAWLRAQTATAPTVTKHSASELGPHNEA